MATRHTPMTSANASKHSGCWLNLGVGTVIRSVGKQSNACKLASTTMGQAARLSSN